MAGLPSYLDIVGHQIDRVEAHTKLTNEIYIPALLHLLQECCATRKSG